MITEDYVSFETAKLLKEKGFDEHCRSFWRRRDWMDETAFCYCGGPYDANNQFCHNSLLESYNDGVYLTDIAAPTLQMAMKWLREVHNIQLVISPYNQIKKNWSYVINKGFTPLTQRFYLFNSYEDACEAAIKHCLENLI